MNVTEATAMYLETAQSNFQYIPMHLSEHITS
jgi:hypothetical protein